MEEKHKKYIAKIKIIEQRWHGWGPEGANIAPKENVFEKESGSLLVISDSTREMVGIWSEKNQNVENMEKVDFRQIEGFRLFISWKNPESVDFNPEVKLNPIKGEFFPVYSKLPLKKEVLKKGESFIIKPFTMDAGVKYEVTVLDIFEKKK